MRASGSRRPAQIAAGREPAPGRPTRSSAALMSRCRGAGFERPGRPRRLRDDPGPFSAPVCPRAVACPPPLPRHRTSCACVCGTRPGVARGNGSSGDGYSRSPGRRDRHGPAQDPRSSTKGASWRGSAPASGLRTPGAAHAAACAPMSRSRRARLANLACSGSSRRTPRLRHRRRQFVPRHSSGTTARSLTNDRDPPNVFATRRPTPPPRALCGGEIRLQRRRPTRPASSFRSRRSATRSSSHASWGRAASALPSASSAADTSRSSSAPTQDLAAAGARRARGPLASPMR